MKRACVLCVLLALALVIAPAGMAQPERAAASCIVPEPIAQVSAPDVGVVATVVERRGGRG